MPVRIRLPNLISVPSEFGGIVAAAIRTPCSAPCLRDAIYLGFHLVPEAITSQVRRGCDDRALIFHLERASPHVPISRCPCCGREGMETTSTDLAEHAALFDLGRHSDDEAYEHLGVWWLAAGEPDWVPIYLHWSLTAHDAMRT